MPSKLSVHLSAYPNRVFDILQKMQPGVVKVFNQSSEMNIDEIRRRCPNAIIVYRQYTNQDYHGSADAFFAEIGDTFNKLRGRGILWEGINEPVVNSTDDAKALSAWWVRLAQLMHAQGELVAGFSWSTGNPTPDKLAQIVPYLIDAATAVDAHAFHEYYSTWGGQKDWGGYRTFEQALPANAHKPVVITEAGLDDNGDSNTGGWRGKKSPQEYLDILKAYDAQLLQDPYVLGATVFQWGDYSWPSFEIDSIMSMISDYAASVGGGTITPKPWPLPIFGPPPPKYSFTVTPATLTVGQSATLQWDVDGSSEVSLNGAAVSPHGTRAVTPAQNTTYTLHIVFSDNTTKDLTATVTVQPAPPTKNASFSANPTSITAGAMATLTWDTHGASAIALNGQPVAASGTRTVSPAQTTIYTLHVVFIDGATQDLSATLSVTPQPPATTRPPTVVITPENIERLKTYPRPAQDNGRGLHFGLDLRDPSIASTVANLLSIGCKWTMIYAPDENQAARAAKACWNAGIMPIIRIGKKVDEPFDPVPYVKALKAAGAPPYVQIYNEPGDNREWKQWPGDSWVGIFAARWAQAAIAVFDAGGYPGLQVLGRDELFAAVDSVKAQNRTEIWSRAFFALHNYGANHPPAYPYDMRNQKDHPGATIFDDDTAVLNLLEFAKWMQERIGFVLPMIGGEGGWEYGAADDTRYPKLEQPYHAQFHKDMFDWFRIGKLSNGEPLPDYLFSIAPWIAGGWGADDWWGGPLGDKMDTINAVKSIPSFVRQFSWDTGGTPMPTYSFTATPTSITAGASSTLKWDVDGASAVSLNGQPVGLHGTQSVAPVQTTTYVLQIVLTDGSIKEASATVTVTFAPPQPGLNWDSQLDALGVKLQRSTAAKAWRLISAKYQDPAQMPNDHHLYFRVLRADGSPSAGLKFVIDWVGRTAGDQPAFVTTEANGEANTPLWASMDPSQKNGIYFTTTQIEPGDTVSGMGLPNSRHVNFVLTFQWNAGATPAPSYSFAATPATIAPGASATLNWNVQGTSNVTLDGHAVSTEGSKNVSPVQTTTYALHLVFPDGSTKDLNATVTVTAALPPPAVEWDPQLDALGVKLTRTNAAPAWRLVAAKYQGPDESGNNHHVYFTALRGDGTPAAGVRFVVDWANRDPSSPAGIVTTDSNGAGNEALWSILRLDKKDGPYFATAKDQPGDTVSGMGLPENRHVNFLLTYKFQ